MTEGAESELLLFSHKWSRWCLSGLVTPQLQLSLLQTKAWAAFVENVGKKCSKCARDVMETATTAASHTFANIVKHDSKYRISFMFHRKCKDRES